jgi:hypothetical protein
MRLWQTRTMTKIRDYLVGAAFVVAIIFSAVYSAKDSDAATASVTYAFSAGQKIVASQVNQNFNDILGAINGNLNTDNILDGGIATADLASNAVSNAKIADDSVTSAKILDGTIATADIATHAVSKIKLAQQNIASSSSTTGSFTIGASGSIVSFASASITTVGRPVHVMLHGDGGSASSLISEGAGGQLAVRIEENFATKDIVIIEAGAGGGVSVPCSSIHWVGQPAAGTYEYILRASSAVGAAAITNCRLKVWEQ